MTLLMLSNCTFWDIFLGREEEEVREMDFRIGCAQNREQSAMLLSSAKCVVSKSLLRARQIRISPLIQSSSKRWKRNLSRVFWDAKCRCGKRGRGLRRPDFDAFFAGVAIHVEGTVLE